MATVRQDKIQIVLDFITDESKALAKAITSVDDLRKSIAKNQSAIADYDKELKKTNLTEDERNRILKERAVAEQAVKQAMKDILASGKEIEKLDLTKVTPAQLTQRANQLAQAMRNIPASAPEFGLLQTELARVNGQLGTLRANAKGIQDDGATASPQVGGFFGSVVGRVAVGVAAVQAFFATVQSFFSFLSTSFKGAEEAAQQDAALKSRIISTNGAAKKSFEELIGQAEELADVTLFDDDQVKRSQEVLLTFTNIKDEVFDETIPTLLDLSTTMKQDVSTSAVQVGKALNDPVAGLKALTRIGVTFSEDQKNVIKALVATGDTAGAQRVILAELRREFGGAAQAAAEAAGGRNGLAQLQKRFGEMKETLGAGLIGLLDRLSPVIGFVVGKFEELAGAISRTFAVPVSEKLREQQTEFNALIGVLKNVNVSEETRKRAIETLQSKYGDYIGNIDLHKATEGQLNEVLQAGNNIFAQRIFLQTREETLTDLERRRNELQGKLFEAEKRLQQANQRTDTGFSFGLNKEQEVLKFSNVVQAYTGQLNFLQKEQDAFLQEQDEFAKRFSLFPGGTPTTTTTTTTTETEEPATPAEKLKKEAEAARGSLLFLRKQVSDLQAEIENTPGDSKALEPLIKELLAAESALKALEDRLEKLKKPQVDVVPTDEQITKELGVPTATPDLLGDKERERIVAFNDFLLQEEELTTEELNRFRQGLSDEDERRRQERLAKEDELQKNIRELEFSAAQSAADAIFSISGNRIQREEEEATAALDAEYKQKIAAAEGNSAAQSRLQKELEKKKEVIERDAAKKRKELAIKEAIVAGALAVIKALPNVFAATAAGIAAAAQIAIISTQKFETGGFLISPKSKLGFFGGQPHSAGGTKGYFDDGTVIEVEKDEGFAIVNKHNAPLLRFLSNINSLGGKGVPFFQRGGLVPRFDTGGLPNLNTTPVIAPLASGVQVQDAGAVQQMQQAAAIMLEAARQFPRTVRSKVVYQDVEDAAAELNTVRDDAAI